MISIRQRKGIKTTEVSEDYAAQEENVKLENKLPSGCTSGRLWKILSFTIGGTVALCIGLLTSVYLATLHENDLWFSNIKNYLRPLRKMKNSQIPPWMKLREVCNLEPQCTRKGCQIQHDSEECRELLSKDSHGCTLPMELPKLTSPKSWAYPKE
uniref:Uncharacterized protein n=1 Tax=Equus asinus TaxID=9793 RepID=A0A9L0JTG1_EQUAS